MKKLCILSAMLMVCFQAGAYKILWGRNITITSPVHEDLYIAGGTVTINAPVYGDLIIAGGTLTINDSVMNDLLLAGGTVFIHGYVGDDIRCAGGELHVQQNVAGDLVITGGQVNIDRGVIIGGGLVTSGGKVRVDGEVKGKVESSAGEMIFNGKAWSGFQSSSNTLVMNGTVLGPARLASRHLTIGNDAAFFQPVHFWTRKGTADFRQSLKKSQAVYDPALKMDGNYWYFLGRSTILGFIWYLGMVMVFILLMQYLFSNTFKKAGDTVYQSTWRSLGLGLIFFIGVPVLSVVLLVTLVGIPLGLLVLFGYVGVILLATIITSVVAANWINNRFNYNWSYMRLVFTSLALFLLFKLISLTPFFGWLVMLLMACVAFGAILINIHWRKHHTIAVH